MPEPSQGPGWAAWRLRVARRTWGPAPSIRGSRPEPSRTPWPACPHCPLPSFDLRLSTPPLSLFF